MRVRRRQQDRGVRRVCMRVPGTLELEGVPWYGRRLRVRVDADGTGRAWMAEKHAEQ